MNRLNMGQSAGVEVVRNRGPRTGNILDALGGSFYVEHWRSGKRINAFKAKNGITNQGKNKLLNVMFDGDAGSQAAAQVDDWYLGLIDNSGFTGLAATNTYEDINGAGNGWDEFTDYTDGNNADDATTRPVWVVDPASGQSVTNSTVAIYNITGTGGTVKGIFAVGGTPADAVLKNNSTTGTTPPNILWSTALFTSGDVVVANTDQIKVTYTVSA